MDDRDTDLPAARDSSICDVVVVDDAPELRLLVRMAVERQGAFRVVAEGATGLDAIELARRHRPQLLLLDVSMPGMDGMTALPLVIGASPETKVVMLSGHEGATTESATRQLGAVAYVDKSGSLRDLPARLAELLWGESAA